MSAYILLVDDELHVSQILGRRLTREGFEIETVRDGIDALAAVEERLPELIISDLQMPRMDGVELVRALAADERFAGIPVIMLTARGHRVADDVMGSTGVRRLIAKPFSAHEVVTIAGEVLEESAGDSDREAA